MKGLPSEGIDLRPFVDGARCESQGSKIARFDPATGDEVAPLGACTESQVDRAVEAAHNASAEWRAISAQNRQDLLLTLARLVTANAEQLGALDSAEMGKPLGSAAMDAQVAAGFLTYAGQSIDKLYGATSPAASGMLETQIRVPHGVVAAIVPWNFPIINVALKAGPALATGNTLVIKPSEIASGSALLFAELAQQAGLPDGVVNIVTGDGATGDALVRHPGVDLVTFTGSTETGRKVMASAACNTLKPVLLECGGKSPQLIFADILPHVSVPELVGACGSAALWNQGQVCVSKSRIHVEAAIADEYIAALRAHLAEIRPEHPRKADCSFGPLASKEQYEKVCKAIAEGEASGARLLLDGREVDRPEGGYYVGPTLFVDVEPDNPLMQKEIFGPVIALSRFRDEQDAIALANATQFGLSAMAWTGDFSRAHRLGQALEAGKVEIRGSLPQGPGCWQAHAAEPMKQSGFGAEGGLAGMSSYTRLKSIQYVYAA